jgi:hypothetical protein
MHLFSRTRLQIPTNFSPLPSAFASIRELQLNDTRLTWQEYVSLERFFPRISHVEMGFNRLSALGEPSNEGTNATLRTLNLDSNVLSDWDQVCCVVNLHPS